MPALNSGQDVATSPRNITRPTGSSLVIVLQFLVGALVTMGGTLFAALAVNSFGTYLGLIHLSIGLTGLVCGFLALRRRPLPRTFLIEINALTVAYSALSESIVQIQSLLPSVSSFGSLIGTIIAVVMSISIISLLLLKSD